MSNVFTDVVGRAAAHINSGMKFKKLLLMRLHAPFATAAGTGPGCGQG